jgi:outer membrane murein-binding lipoprotein Lpp
MLLFRVLVFSFLFLGCSIKEPNIQEVNKKINELEVLITSLSPKVDRREAKLLYTP